MPHQALIPYDNDKSIWLAQCAALAYDQTRRNKGEITPPKTSLTEVACLEAHEIITEKYIGYILESDAKDEYVLVFRGAKYLEELIAAFELGQTGMTLYKSSTGKDSTDKYVEKGLYDFWTDKLADEVMDLLKGYSATAKLRVCGHSFGGGFSVLAALEAQEAGLFTGGIEMYNIGAMRVGDENFKTYYNGMVPNSYRVVNLADFAPTWPPNNLPELPYKHVGELWAFLTQWGNTDQNHSPTETYIPALEQGVVVRSYRDYPISAT